MHQPTISCPSCKTEIRITETLAAPLLAETRRQFEVTLQAKDSAMQAREAALAAERQSLADARTALEVELAARVAAESEKIAKVESQRAKAAMAEQLDATASQLREAQAQLHERGLKLAEAQAAQAEALRLQRELADARRELDLTVERKVTEGLEQVRQKARADAEQELRMKVSEREEQIAAMQRQIEDLKRRAEQGSQQLQGEVSELDLEAALTKRFPLDAVSAVGKVSLVPTWCRRSSLLRASCAGPSCGSASEPRIGAATGCQSCAPINEPPVLRSRCLFPTPGKKWRRSASSMASGSPTHSMRCRWR